MSTTPFLDVATLPQEESSEDDSETRGGGVGGAGGGAGAATASAYCFGSEETVDDGSVGHSFYAVRPPMWVELCDGSRIDIHHPHKKQLGTVRAPEKVKKAGWWHAFSVSIQEPYFKVYCNICGTGITVSKGGSTSSLMRHLQSCNEDVYRVCSKINKEIKADQLSRRVVPNKRKSSSISAGGGGCGGGGSSRSNGGADDVFFRSQQQQQHHHHQSSFADAVAANIPLETATTFDHHHHPAAAAAAAAATAATYEELCDRVMAREREMNRKKRAVSTTATKETQQQVVAPVMPAPPPPPPPAAAPAAPAAPKPSNPLSDNLKYLAFGALYYEAPIEGVTDIQAGLVYKFCKDNPEEAGEILADAQEYKRRREKNTNVTLSPLESIKLIVTVAKKNKKKRR